jgi:hypothetical protein
MRAADIAEVRASCGLDHYSALLESIRSSSCCYTAWVGQSPIAIFGIAPTDNPSIARIWLLGTDQIQGHALEFLRKSREWVDHFQSIHPVLFNNIDARNTVHIRWLQWLGFTFINQFPDYGAESRPFYQFVRIDQNV